MAVIRCELGLKRQVLIECWLCGKTKVLRQCAPPPRYTCAASNALGSRLANRKCRQPLFSQSKTGDTIGGSNKQSVSQFELRPLLHLINPVVVRRIEPLTTVLRREPGNDAACCHCVGLAVFSIRFRCEGLGLRFASESAYPSHSVPVRICWLRIDLSIGTRWGWVGARSWNRCARHTDWTLNCPLDPNEPRP
jgi:hypothetical protein